MRPSYPARERKVQETIARLADRWRKQAAQGLGSRRDRRPLLRIETLAASTLDPQQYPEAALEVIEMIRRAPFPPKDRINSTL
jgi:hypothetical protein